MKNYDQFIKESIRDKMVGVTIENALEKLFKSNNYDKILNDTVSYFISIDNDISYTDQIYFEILKRTDFYLIKKNINDIIDSVFKIQKRNKNSWLIKAAEDFKSKGDDLKTFKDLHDLIFEIEDKTGDVYYRDEILKQLIKKQDLEKTKKIIIEMIKGS